MPGDSIAAVAESGRFLRKTLPEAVDARILVIAGSGLGGFVRAVNVENEVSYNSIPHVGGSTVEGHAGKLLLGKLETDTTPILLMAGRRHLYEGLSAMEAAHLPQSVFSA